MISFIGFLIFNFIIILNNVSCIDVDPKGYILFCPCLGRFGNQMDQFLGTLAFAKGLERTLVLPHWIEYWHDDAKNLKTRQKPFDDYFKVEPLKQYTKVILMSDFMKSIAPKIWPKGKRIAFCHGHSKNSNKKCEHHEEIPFASYWRTFDIKFNKDIIYSPLRTYTYLADNHQVWKKKYPAQTYPVLAFTGAPGEFPVHKANVHLQKYLKWSDSIQAKAAKFLKTMTKKGEKVIGIHLRNGRDFKQACQDVKENRNEQFFASAQCTGYNYQNGRLTREMCYPSEKTIVQQLKSAIKEHNAKYIFIAYDHKHFMETFKKEFPKTSLIVYNVEDSPHVDLCVLGQVDHAILNCVSTFSAIAKRERDVNKKTTEFWAFKPIKNKEL